MMLRILLIALISSSLAQRENERRPARAPQGQIKYDDPTGLKVDWRFFGTQNQYRSQSEQSQRAQREESQVSQPLRSPPPESQQRHQSKLVQPPPQAQSLVPVQPVLAAQYKPYSAVPTQIKQLLIQAYQPQRPYVDESAFFYNSNFAVPQQYDQQPATAEFTDYEQIAQKSYSESYSSDDQQKLQSRRDYDDGEFKGKIEYKESEDQQEQQQQQHQQVQQIAVPIETMPVQPPPKLLLDKSMPSEIQQLLQFQAQIPYDVIANRIIYKPKTLFIPKPLSDDTKGPYYYRSKVYYVKNEYPEPDFVTTKPVEEERH